MNDTTQARRQLLTGMLGVLGGGLLARDAQAFAPSAQGEFQAASRILRRYGVTVSGEDGGGTDLLKLDIAQQPATDYVTRLSRLDAVAGVDPEPFHMTTTSGALVTFEVFDPNVGAGIDPSPFHVTTADGQSVSFAIFDTDEGAGIAPCVKLAHDETGTVFEHYDPNAGAGILPCVKTAVIGHHQHSHEIFDASTSDATPQVRVSSVHENGVPQLTQVEVNDPAAAFAVQIGERSYVLQDGALVEQRQAPSENL